MHLNLKSKLPGVPCRYLAWGKARQDNWSHMLFWDWYGRDFLLLGISIHWVGSFDRCLPNFWVSFHLLGLRIWYRHEAFNRWKYDYIKGAGDMCRALFFVLGVIFVTIYLSYLCLHIIHQFYRAVAIIPPDWDR